MAVKDVAVQWLVKSSQPFCLTLVIRFPLKQIFCQQVLSKAILDYYIQPTEKHGSQVSTLRKYLSLL